MRTTSLPWMLLVALRVVKKRTRTRRRRKKKKRLRLRRNSASRCVGWAVSGYWNPDAMLAFIGTNTRQLWAVSCDHGNKHRETGETC